MVLVGLNGPHAKLLHVDEPRFFRQYTHLQLLRLDGACVTVRESNLVLFVAIQREETVEGSDLNGP